MPKITQIAPYQNGCYFLYDDGTVKAVGRPADGAHGDNTTSTAGRWLPTTVTPSWAPATVVKLAAFNAGGYIIDSDGVAWAWGYGTTGAIGDGRSSSHARIPVKIGGANPPWGTDKVTHIEGRSDGGVCVTNNTANTNQRVWTWGSNEYGQIGDGRAKGGAHVTSPVQVAKVWNGDVVKLSAVFFTISIFTSTKDVWSWGRGWYGSLGSGNTNDAESPLKVNYGGTGVGYASDVVQFNSGLIILTDAGRAYGAGGAGAGQFGNGQAQNSLPLLRLDEAWPFNVNDIASLHCKGEWLMARLKDGKVFTWGNRGTGRLGIGFTLDQRPDAPTGTSPTEIATTGFDLVAAGGDTGYAVKGDYLYTWGNNLNNRAAYNTNPANHMTPSLVAWSAIDACASVPEHGELVTVKADLVATKSDLTIRTGELATANTTIASQQTTITGLEDEKASLVADKAALEQSASNAFVGGADLARRMLGAGLSAQEILSRLGPVAQPVVDEYRAQARPGAR